MRKLTIVLGVLGVSLLNAQYTGNVGVNTDAPTNTLHVKSNADPLRLEGLQNVTENKGILVVDKDGVVKKIGGQDTFTPSFETKYPSGEPKISGSSMANNKFTPINFSSSNVKVGTETNGQFVVEEDGWYHLDGNIRFEVLQSTPNHPISFNGKFMQMMAIYRVKDPVTNASYRVGYTEKSIFRGAHIPDAPAPVGMTEVGVNKLQVGVYHLTPTGTVYLKKGQIVSLEYFTYGGVGVITTSDNGVEAPDRAWIDTPRSYSRIYRIL